MTALAEHPAAKRRDNRLVEVDGVPYTWSANGELLDDGERTYTYDHGGRLSSVVVGQQIYTFAYNGLGDRLVQMADGARTQYTLDLNAGLTQVLSDGPNTYLYGLNRVGQFGAGGWSYHLPDALGSVRQMADPAAAATFAQAYEPYGNVLEVAGEARTPYGFAGEWMDRTGLVHLRARYYAPYFGRFITKDSWPGNPSSPASLNRWNYVMSNPVTYSDPSGRWCVAGFSFGPGRSCTEDDRRQAAQFLQYYSGYFSSPNFALGFLYEFVDSIVVMGPETSRIAINGLLESTLELEAALEITGASLFFDCGNETPMLVIELLRNGIRGDAYFVRGRVYGRLSALLLATTEVTISTSGALVGAAAAPFTAGISLGGSAVAVSISAHGAAVVGSILVKEVNDQLMVDFFSGKSGSGFGDDAEPSREWWVERKVEKDMQRRGWTDEEVEEIINSPADTESTRDFRHDPRLN